jgi:hypothetical protein
VPIVIEAGIVGSGFAGRHNAASRRNPRRRAVEGGNGVIHAGIEHGDRCPAAFVAGGDRSRLLDQGKALVQKRLVAAILVDRLQLRCVQKLAEARDADDPNETTIARLSNSRITSTPGTPLRADCRRFV